MEVSGDTFKRCGRLIQLSLDGVVQLRQVYAETHTGAVFFFFFSLTTIGAHQEVGSVTRDRCDYVARHQLL